MKENFTYIKWKKIERFDKRQRKGYDVGNTSWVEKCFLGENKAKQSENLKTLYFPNEGQEAEKQLNSESPNFCQY